MDWTTSGAHYYVDITLSIHEWKMPMVYMYCIGDSMANECLDVAWVRTRTFIGVMTVPSTRENANYETPPVFIHVCTKPKRRVYHHISTGLSLCKQSKSAHDKHCSFLLGAVGIESMHPKYNTHETIYSLQTNEMSYNCTLTSVNLASSVLVTSCIVE